MKRFENLSVFDLIKIHEEGEKIGWAFFLYPQKPPASILQQISGK
jgi:hypothetical protein